MNSIHLIRGLRVARLDRILDALAGRDATAPEPRPRRRPRSTAAQLPPLGLRFLPTV